MLIPDRMGVMILGEASLFPQAMMPLFIFEPRYRAMLGDSLESHRMFCMAMQRMDAVRESPARIATLGLVRASVQNPNGTSNLVLQGLIRVRLGKIAQTRPYRKHLITPVKESRDRSSGIEALLQRAADGFRRAGNTPQSESAAMGFPLNLLIEIQQLVGKAHFGPKRNIAID